MATTLSITLDDKTMARVGKIAAERATDPAGLIQRILVVLANWDRPVDAAQLPPITASAFGILLGLPDKPYKGLLEEAILEKFGRGV